MTARIAGWALPEAAILAAAVVAPRVLASPELLGSVAVFSAYAALGAGLFLGLRFRRPRLLLSLLVLALAARGLPDLPPPFSAGERIAFQSIGLLLPLCLAGISLLPERGLLTRAGLTRLGIILVLAALVAAAVHAAPRSLATTLESRFAPKVLTAWTPLGQPALAAFALALVACGGALLFDSGQGGRAGLWALIAAGFAVISHPGSHERTLYFAAAGLILAGTFASLMFAEGTFFKSMGFSFAVGIALAAFVMALFLTPALTALLGHAAWWPGHGDRARDAVEEPAKEPVP